MNADLRIATLALHGCVMVRHPRAHGNDPDWRCVVRYPPQLHRTCLVWRARAIPHKGMKWFVAEGVSPAKIETPFEAGLIETIPEKMFMQYLYLLTH